MTASLGNGGMVDKKWEIIKRINFWRKQNNEKKLNIFVMDKLSERCLEEVLRFQYTLFLSLGNVL
jgi:hypothetical protein